MHATSITDPIAWAEKVCCMHCVCTVQHAELHHWPSLFAHISRDWSEWQRWHSSEYLYDRSVMRGEVSCRYSPAVVFD